MPSGHALLYIAYTYTSHTRGVELAAHSTVHTRERKKKVADFESLSVSRGKSERAGPGSRFGRINI